MDHIKNEILGETMATYSDTYLNLNFKIGLSKPVCKIRFCDNTGFDINMSVLQFNMQNCGY